MFQSLSLLQNASEENIQLKPKIVRIVHNQVTKTIETYKTRNRMFSVTRESLYPENWTFKGHLSKYRSNITKMGVKIREFHQIIAKLYIPTKFRES